MGDFASRPFIIPFLLGAAVLSTGCSHVSKKEFEENITRIQLLEKNNAKQADLIEELFHRQEALAKSLAHSRKSAGAAGQIATPMSPPDEVSLYSKVIESFRNKQADVLERVTRMLEKIHPKSIYLDNAYFLNARLGFEREQWTDAKEWIYRLENNFPFSSKVVAAQLLNARIERRLGDKSRALGIFESLGQEFPGSPEAFQGKLERIQLAEEG